MMGTIDKLLGRGNSVDSKAERNMEDSRSTEREAILNKRLQDRHYLVKLMLKYRILVLVGTMVFYFDQGLQKRQ
jgi:hypothetical protein